MRNLPKAEARRIARTGHAGSLCDPWRYARRASPERVLFFREVHVRQLFVAANVHGTDDNRLRAARFSDRFIGGKLLFFRRQRVAIHEQEFSTIQTNAFRAVALSAFNVTNGTDVGANFNLMSIQRDCRQIFQFSQFRFLGRNLLWTARSCSITSLVGLT